MPRHRAPGGRRDATWRCFGSFSLCGPPRRVEHRNRRSARQPVRARPPRKLPVEEVGLAGAALAEAGRGATRVKVIADFPDLAAGPTHGVLPQHVALEHRARIEGRRGVLTGGYDRLVRFPAGVAQKMQSITPARYAAGTREHEPQPA
jgi:hypothetical protein